MRGYLLSNPCGRRDSPAGLFGANRSIRIPVGLAKVPGIFQRAAKWFRVAAFILSLVLAGRVPESAHAVTAPALGSLAAASSRSILFEPNLGQSESGALFLARGPGFTAYFAADHVTFRIKNCPDSRRPQNRRSAVGAIPPEPCLESGLRLEFVDHSKLVVLNGRDELLAKAHYFVGRDPTAWRRNVPQFGRLRYEGLYPGVDIEFYSTGGQIEYDLILASSADLTKVRLRFPGTEGRRVTASGDLELMIAGRTILQRRPLSRQGSTPVAVQYRMRADGDIVFDTNAQLAGSLVVDPVLDFSTFLGGSRSDFPYAAVLGPKGDLYVAGTTQSYDFPGTDPDSPRPGKPRGGKVAFVSKINPEQWTIAYSIYLGGSGESDIAIEIQVDAFDRPTLTGITDSADFPVTENAFQATHGGGRTDIFITRFSASGDQLEASTFLGGSSIDLDGCVAFGNDGALWIAGGTQSEDFPSRSPLQPSNQGDYDAFVAELSPDFSELLFSTYLGGAFSDGASACMVNRQGNLVLAGSTSSRDFPTRVPATPDQQPDPFVLEIGGHPRQIYSSMFFGGVADDLLTDMTLDADDFVYAVGQTMSFDFPTTKNALRPRRTGIPTFEAGFVTKLNLTSETLEYSTYLSGDPPGGDYPGEIVVDTDGYAYISGETGTRSFPSVRALQPSYGGHISDAFVSKLDPSGSRLIYSTFLGGRLTEGGQGLALGPDNALYVVGDTDSAEFPLVDPLTSKSPDGGDVFISVIRDPVVPAPGDCNEDTTTTLPEVVQGVAALLDARTLGDCQAADEDGSRSVSVDELVDSVNAASP